MFYLVHWGWHLVVSLEEGNVHEATIPLRETRADWVRVDIERIFLIMDDGKWNEMKDNRERETNGMFFVIPNASIRSLKERKKKPSLTKLSLFNRIDRK